MAVGLRSPGGRGGRGTADAPAGPGEPDALKSCLPYQISDYLSRKCRMCTRSLAYPSYGDVGTPRNTGACTKTSKSLPRNAAERTNTRRATARHQYTRRVFSAPQRPSWYTRRLFSARRPHGRYTRRDFSARQPSSWYTRRLFSARRPHGRYTRRLFSARGKQKARYQSFAAGDAIHSSTNAA